MLKALNASSTLAPAQEGSCCSRFSRDLRSIPAIVTLVANFVAVLLCLIWNQPSLAMFFAGSALCSTYTLYQARLLSTYKDIDDNVRKMGLENTQYKQQNEEYRLLLATMQKRSTTLDNTIDQLRQQLEAATLSGGELKENVGTLERQITALEKCQKAYHSGLEMLISATDGVKSATSMQQGKTEALQKVISSMDEGWKKLIGEGQQSNQAFSGLIKDFNATLESCKTLFTAFSAEDVAALLQSTLTLQKQAKEAEATAETARKTTVALQTQNDILSASNKALKANNIEYAAETARLRVEREGFHDLHGKFASVEKRMSARLDAQQTAASTAQTLVSASAGNTSPKSLSLTIPTKFPQADEVHV